MIDSTVHAAIVEWLASVSGATVVQAYQSAPPPAEPYISVALDATREVSEYPIALPIVATGRTINDPTIYLSPEDDIWLDENGLPISEFENIRAEVEQAPAIEREWQFGLHAMGAGGDELLRKIRVSSHVTYHLQNLYPLKIHQIGQVNRLPDERNLRWENRAACDLFLRGITRDGVLIETIESAPVTISRTA